MIAAVAARAETGGDQDDRAEKDGGEPVLRKACNHQRPSEHLRNKRLAIDVYYERTITCLRQGVRVRPSGSRAWHLQTICVRMCVCMYVYVYIYIYNEYQLLSAFNRI